jgi:hypothetical protein
VTAPLTYAQEHYLAGHWLSPLFGEKMHVSYRLLGEVDPDALRHAVTHLVHRHDALRLRVVRDGADHVQYDAGPVAGDMVTMRADSYDGTPTGFRDLVSGWLAGTMSEKWRPDRDPMARFGFFRRDAGEWGMAAVFSPLAVDGRALNLLIGDFCDGYRRAAGRREQAGPAPSFLAGAARQRDRSARRALTVNSAYWREKLRPDPRFAGLAHWQSRPAADDSCLIRMTHVGPARLRKIRAAAAGHSASGFQWFLWALLAAVSTELELDRVAARVAVDSRDAADRGTSGMFGINPVLVADRDPSGGLPFATVRREMFRSISHALVPAAVLDDCRDRLADSDGIHLGRLFTFAYAEMDDDWDRQPDLDGVRLERGAFLPSDGTEAPLVDMVVHATPSAARIKLGTNRAVISEPLAAAVERRLLEALSGAGATAGGGSAS